MEKLVLPIHASDHCPGGPDPIPCLGGLPSAMQGFSLSYNNTGGYPTGFWVATSGTQDTTDPSVIDYSGAGMILRTSGTYSLHLHAQLIVNSTVLDVGGSTRDFPGEASVVVEPHIEGWGLEMETKLRSERLNDLDLNYSLQYEWHFGKSKLTVAPTFESYPLAVAPVILLQDPLLPGPPNPSGACFLTVTRLGDAPF